MGERLSLLTSASGIAGSNLITSLYNAVLNIIATLPAGYTCAQTKGNMNFCPFCSLKTVKNQK